MLVFSSEGHMKLFIMCIVMESFMNSFNCMMQGCSMISHPCGTFDMEYGERFISECVMKIVALHVLCTWHRSWLYTAAFHTLRAMAEVWRPFLLQSRMDVPFLKHVCLFVLRNQFHIDSFRPGQLETSTAVMKSSSDIVSVMATGLGKVR